MANVRFAFEVLRRVTPEQMREVRIKPGFKYVITHMIIFIKMDGKFNHKAILVAGGHNTEPPSTSTYSIVVTRKMLYWNF